MKETKMAIWVSIGKLAKKFGVTTQSIRNWTKQGKLAQPIRTMGGHRRYNWEEIEGKKERKTIAYARVSSADQKNDLKRQREELEVYCKEKGYSKLEVIEDIGSGINYKKRGIKKVISQLLSGEVERIVISYEDRLVRFGIEILQQICKAFDVTIEVIHEKSKKGFEEELASDVLTILTVFCSKIYGRRSHEKRKKRQEKKEQTSKTTQGETKKYTKYSGSKLSAKTR